MRKITKRAAAITDRATVTQVRSRSDRYLLLATDISLGLGSCIERARLSVSRAKLAI
jgi:hypothetical protein